MKDFNSRRLLEQKLMDVQVLMDLVEGIKQSIETLSAAKKDKDNALMLSSYRNYLHDSVARLRKEFQSLTSTLTHNSVSQAAIENFQEYLASENINLEDIDKQIKVYEDFDVEQLNLGQMGEE